MAAIWVILAKTAYPAELIQSFKEGGASAVSIPFELSAEYTPPLTRADEKEVIRLAQGLPPAAPEFGDIIHRCSEMRRIVEKCRVAAARNVPVLLHGESGTGKELLARAIHASSPRSEQPFVSVNCGAVPDNLFESEFFGYEKGAFTGADSGRGGYFENADGGTLFLDEIGELSKQSQVKLLRVLQEGRVRRLGGKRESSVDVRIISATNLDLPFEVGGGNFREDLFHRIAIGVVHVPPLRERRGDLGLLIDYFLELANKEIGASAGAAWKDRDLSPGARNTLLKHSWPGNARELRNAIFRMVLWSVEERIDKREASDALLVSSGGKTRKGLGWETRLLELEERKRMDLREFVAGVAATFIDKAIALKDGKKGAAAHLLGFNSYQTMDNWRKRSK
jgi:transcriptional regulator with PAS, ATPase and Fis domain